MPPRRKLLMVAYHGASINKWFLHGSTHDDFNLLSHSDWHISPSTTSEKGLGIYESSTNHMYTAWNQSPNATHATNRLWIIRQSNIEAITREKAGAKEVTFPTFSLKQLSDIPNLLINGLSKAKAILRNQLRITDVIERKVFVSNNFREGERRVVRVWTSKVRSRDTPKIRLLENT